MKPIIEKEIDLKRTLLMKGQFETEYSLIEDLRVVTQDITRNMICDRLVELLHDKDQKRKQIILNDMKAIQKQQSLQLCKEAARTGETPEIVKDEMAKYGFHDLQKLNPEEQRIADIAAKQPSVSDYQPEDLQKAFQEAIKNKETTKDMIERLKKDLKSFDDMFHVDDDELTKDEVKVYTDAGQNLTDKKLMTARDLTKAREEKVLAEAKKKTEKKVKAIKKQMKAKKAKKNADV